MRSLIECFQENSRLFNIRSYFHVIKLLSILCCLLSPLCVDARLNVLIVR